MKAYFNLLNIASYKAQQLATSFAKKKKKKKKNTKCSHHVLYFAPKKPPTVLNLEFILRVFLPEVVYPSPWSCVQRDLSLFPLTLQEN